VVTLRDIADAAGVSVSTVSRALDERAPSRTETAQRIRSIADELGYRRNTFASNLRRGATATIGVLVPRLSDTVMALMFEAVERAALRQGYFAIVATSGDDAEDEATAASTLLDRNVDGLILASSRLGDPLPAQLRADRVPHALVLRTDGISPSAVGDDEAGGYLAVRHLIDLGHTDIAILTGPLFTSSANGRLTGARRALTEAGIPCRDEWVVESGYGIEDGARAAEAVLARHDTRPTALFCANDNLAVGAISATHRHSLTIGKDLSLVGYNDIPLAARLPVPLTSVRTAFDTIAATALDLVLDTSQQPAVVHTVLPTLIPRASTRRPSASQVFTDSSPS
jgi:LacI family transcriptional regulator